MEEEEKIIERIKNILNGYRFTAFQRIMLKRNHPEIYQYMFSLGEEICYRKSTDYSAHIGNRAVYNIVQNTGNYLSTSRTSIKTRNQF